MALKQRRSMSQLHPVLDSSVALTGPWELLPGHCLSLLFRLEASEATIYHALGDRLFLNPCAKPVVWSVWPIGSAAEAWRFLHEPQFSPLSVPFTIVPGPQGVPKEDFFPQ